MLAYNRERSGACDGAAGVRYPPFYSGLTFASREAPPLISAVTSLLAHAAPITQGEAVGQQAAGTGP